VAVDDLEKKILICEVKLQKKRLNLDELVSKSEKLLQKYSHYDVEYKLLSVEDLGLTVPGFGNRRQNRNGTYGKKRTFCS